MIREVTYYQAQCDRCGTVDDGGEFSAWIEPDHARMTATDSCWIEIEVDAPSGAEGANVYTYTPEGKPSYKRLSILLCESCQGDGIQWCAKCEDDLDEAKWTLWPSGNRISQTCPNRHENRIDMKVSQNA